MSRWISAVQVRLLCVTDSGSVLFWVRLSRLKADVESAVVALGEERVEGFFSPCSDHSEYRMVLSCKAASL